MKTYAQKATAQKIATSKSKNGEVWEVEEKNGKFAVVHQNPPAEEATADTASTDAAEPAATGDASEKLKIRIKNARIGEKYVITPPMGGGKSGVVERWFEMKRLEDVKQVGSAVEMTVSRRALATRHISEDEYELVA